MRPRKGTTIATYGLLCLAGGISFVMPEAMDVPSVPAITPVPVRLTGPAETSDDARGASPEERTSRHGASCGTGTTGALPHESRPAFALCP